MNSITVCGNIGEPTLRFTKNGKAVLSFGLATTLATLAYILRFLRQRITSKYPRHKLANDGMAELVAKNPDYFCGWLASLPMNWRNPRAGSNVAVRPSREISIIAATSKRGILTAVPGSANGASIAGCASTRSTLTSAPAGVTTALPSSHSSLRVLSHAR